MVDFLSQPITGVQRFAIEICKQLIEIHPQLTIIVPVGTNCLHEELLNHIEYYGGRRGTVWEQTDLVRFMNRSGRVLLNLCNTAPIWHNKNVVTIHDLGVYVNPKWYSRTFACWYKFLTPRVLKKAVGIVTVSKFSKGEIVRIFNIKTRPNTCCVQRSAKRFQKRFQP